MFIGFWKDMPNYSNVTKFYELMHSNPSETAIRVFFYEPDSEQADNSVIIGLIKDAVEVNNLSLLRALAKALLCIPIETRLTLYKRINYPFKVPLLMDLIIHNASCECFQILLTVIPEGYRLELINQIHNDGMGHGVLYLARSRGCINQFIELLSSLKVDERITALLTTIPNEKLFDTLVCEVDHHKDPKKATALTKIWPLLPKNRMDLLLNGDLLTRPTKASIFRLLKPEGPFFSTLSLSDLSTLTYHPFCPTYIETPADSQAKKLARIELNSWEHRAVYANLAQVKSCTTNNAKTLTSNEINTITQANLPISYDYINLLIYFLAMHAGYEDKAEVDLCFVDSPMRFGTQTALNLLRQSEISFDALVLENQAFIKFIDALPSYTPSCPLIVNLASIGQDCYATFSIRKEPVGLNDLSFLNITLYDNQQNTDFEVLYSLQRLMTRMFVSTKYTLKFDIQTTPVNNNADSLIYAANSFLSVCMGDAYKLVLDPEIIKIIKKQIAEFLSPDSCKTAQTTVVHTAPADTGTEKSNIDTTNSSTDNGVVYTTTPDTRVEDAYSEIKDATMRAKKNSSYLKSETQDRLNLELDLISSIPVTVATSLPPPVLNAPPTDAQIRLVIEQLSQVKLHADKLHFKSYKESELLTDVFDNVQLGFNKFISHQIGKAEFRIICEENISPALKVFGYSTNLDSICKKILYNLALAIVGLGIGFVIAGLYNLYQTNGRNFFFSYNSQTVDKLVELQKFIDEAVPPPEMLTF